MRPGGEGSVDKFWIGCEINYLLVKGGILGVEGPPVEERGYKNGKVLPALRFELE